MVTGLFGKLADAAAPGRSSARGPDPWPLGIVGFGVSGLGVTNTLAGRAMGFGDGWRCERC